MNLQRADDAPDRCSECGAVEELTRQAGQLVCIGCRQVMEEDAERYAADTAMMMLAHSRSWA